LPVDGELLTVVLDLPTGGSESASLAARVIASIRFGSGTWRPMSILWIILIVVLILALLGFFSRGYW
jgi:hypothetical protein